MANANSREKGHLFSNRVSAMENELGNNSRETSWSIEW